MEIKDIKNAVSRNRTMEQYELARNKLANEAKNIVKLRVKQEVRYWELKEKFDTQIKINENLKANLQDVTSNLESISIKYQDEINERQEIINKVQSTNEITQVLEMYFNTLKDNLSQHDLMINATDESFKELQKKIAELQMREKQKSEMFAIQKNHLEEKLKMAVENKENLLNLYKRDKDQFTKEIQDYRAQLDKALECKYQLTDKLKDLLQELEALKKENLEKQKTILEIQKEGQQIIDEYDRNMSELKNDNSALKEKITAANEKNDGLKEALSKQQETNGTLQQKINEMNDKISAYEEELVLHKDNIEKLKQMLADAENKRDEKQDMINLLFQQKNKLNEEISSIKSAAEDKHKEKDEIITNLQKSKAELEKDISQLRVELGERDKKIESLSEQYQELTDALRARDEDKTTILQEIESKLDEADKMYKNKMSEALAKQREEYEEEMIAKDNMLQQATERMQELELAKHRLELRMERITTETENEKALRSEQIKLTNDKINVLENNAKTKEDELDVQMKLILELKSEKEVLQKNLKKAHRMLQSNAKVYDRKRHNDSILPDDEHSVSLFLPELEDVMPRKIPKTPKPDSSMQGNEMPHSTASIPQSPVLHQSRDARNSQAGPSTSTSSNPNATEPIRKMEKKFFKSQRPMPK